MKKAAISSLLLLGGFGSLRYLTAHLRDLNLHFDLRDEEACYYC